MIRLDDGTGNYIDFEQPEFGYKTEIRRAIESVESETGIELIDNGVEFDTRVCKVPRFLLDTGVNASGISEWISTFAGGMGKVLDLILGETHTGFFPFGPDYGDAGTFQVIVSEKRFTGILQAPYLHFGMELEMVLQSTHSRVPINEIAEGNLQLGEVAGLMYPQESINNPYEYGLKTEIGAAGHVEFSDNSWNKYNSEFVLRCNTSKAAAVANYFSEVARSTAFNMITGANFYMLGIDREGVVGNTYSVKQTDSTIVITHVGHEHFNISLNLQESFS